MFVTQEGRTLPQCDGILTPKHRAVPLRVGHIKRATTRLVTMSVATWPGEPRRRVCHDDHKSGINLAGRCEK